MNGSVSPIVLNISGGASSGLMTRIELDRHGGCLPEHYYPVFCNTGKEREETLEFVHEIESRWGIPITWLEYRYYPHRTGGPKYPKHDYVIVDYETASRDGEPFEQLVTRNNFLPKENMRTCTTEMKINTVDRYMRRGHGIREYQVTLGLRYDEPRRYMRHMNNPQVRMPLVEKKVTTSDVKNFWQKQPFRLGIESWLGNCDRCYLKSKSKLLQSIRAEPNRAEWWSRMETVTGDTFRQKESFDDLIAVSKQPELFDELDDGRDECFCTD